LLSLLVSAWNKQAELVTLTSQVSESTPPIAAVLSVFLLLGANAFLSRSARALEATGDAAGRLSHWLRRLMLTRGEILVVFVFLGITAAMPGVGLFRQVMPCVMVCPYFGNPTNHLAEMSATIPHQLAVTDPELARVFWEGGDVTLPSFGLAGIPVIGPVLETVLRFLSGPTLVPWRYWLTPFLFWSAYLCIYFVAMFCLVTVFRRAWEEDERLTFPVASIAVEMLRPEGSSLSGKAFFGDPLVWIGFSLAVVYNALNALKVFNPGVMALGISYPIGALFTESPWDTMNGLSIFYKPEILGVGYMVPSDVLFSIWFFTLLSWIVRPFAKMAGYTAAGFPFVTDQAIGAFILLGLYFIYQSRGRILQVARRALALDEGPDDRDEPLSHRLAFLGAMLGIVAIIGLPILFGVKWWVSVMYFGIMVLVLVVYCRNRAEMGFPIVWGYPLYQERSVMVNFLGSAPFVSSGHLQSFTVLTMFSWLQRSVNQAITSFGQEAYVSGHKLGHKRSALARIVIFALIFGVLLAFVVNLAAYYEYGGLVLSSPGGTEGGQMTQEVLGQYTQVSQWIDTPEGPNLQRIPYVLFGAAMVLMMIVTRRASVRFPFHPGGYALAFCHEAPFMWFPALLLWGIKSIVMHVGGIGLYKRLAPAFMAFTIGHFFSVGVWSLVGLYAGEWVRRYIVWFL
jgi:hypothetical protein